MKVKRTEMAFIRQWTIATGLGLSVGVLIVLLTYVAVFDQGPYELYLLGLILRSMLQVIPVAVLQSRLLPRLSLSVPRWQWISATALGMGIVMLIRIAATIVPNLGNGTPIFALSFEGSWVLNYTYYIVRLPWQMGDRAIFPYVALTEEGTFWALTYGLVIGFFQFLCLRRQLRNAAVWIVFNSAIFEVCISIASSVWLLNPHWRLWSLLFGNTYDYLDTYYVLQDLFVGFLCVLILFISGSAIGFVTGQALIWLRRESDELQDQRLEQPQATQHI